MTRLAPLVNATTPQTHTATCPATDNTATDYAAGVAAARDIWENCNRPGYAYPDDPQTYPFAAGAMAEFERLQRQGQHGLAGKIASGAQVGAQQLTVDKEHGLIEVLQNADDLRATRVDYWLETGAVNVLHMCHNGAPVLIEHLLGMTFAFVSTKRGDAHATGKFGVGLKTLGRLGRRLEVHSGTYAFAVESLCATALPQRTSLGSGFFDLARGDTLLSLTLDPDIDCTALASWCATLDNALLLFLRSVSQASFITPAGTHRLELTRLKPEPLAAGIRRRRLQEGDDCHVIYEREVAVPPRLARDHKATASATTIALAASASCMGKFYATLPTRISSALPFALNADFDPGTARDSLLDTSWNSWLLGELGQLVADTVIALLATEPDAAWLLAPLPQEVDCSDPWLGRQIVQLQSAALATIEAKGRLQVDNRSCRLNELCFISEELDTLLEPGDAEQVCPGQTLIPTTARDAGDYRLVLAAAGASLVDLDLAFTLFDCPEAANRSAAWCAQLVRLALRRGRFDLLRAHRCFVLENGRTALMDSGAASEWLTLASPQAPLRRLGLVKQLVADYRSLPDWEELEATLAQHFNFRHTISPAGYLEALAARPEPIYLTPGELLEVRRLLDLTTSSSLGHRLGQVILLDAIEYRGGRRSKLQALACACYLPKGVAQEKHSAWARAAEGVPGIVWAAPGYKQLLQGSRRQAGTGGEKSARRFLQELGCATAPRLRPLPGRTAAVGQLAAAQALLVPARDVRLAGDHEAPELDLVLAALPKLKKRDQAERALALFAALSYAWETYAERATASAEWDEKRRVERRAIPATWLARAATARWVLNGRRRLETPAGLAIDTTINRAIYAAEPERLAFGLAALALPSGLARALHMLVEPTTAELLEQLRLLKAGPASDWPRRGPVLMLALAGRYEQGRTGNDGLSATELRRAMNSEQLFYLKSHDEWLAPARLLLGSDIFGGRRRFIQEHSRNRALLLALQIAPPTLADCLEVLGELGEQKVCRAADEQTIVQALRVVELKLDGAQDLSELARLPLWCGDRFFRSRPVFVTADPELAQALAGPLRFWQAPFDPLARPQLLAALKVNVLGAAQLRVNGGGDSSAADPELNQRFQRAVSLIKDRLAREDDACYRAVSWPQLEDTTVALAASLTLTATITQGRGGPFEQTVPVQAHAETTPTGQRHYYRTVDAIAADHAGGRLVAAAFAPGYRNRVAPLWFWAWSRAELTAGAAGLELAVDGVGDEASTLEELARASLAAGRRPTAAYPQHSGSGSAAPAPARPEPIVVRLKPVELLTTAAVAAVNPDAPAGGQRPGQGRGLKKNVGRPGANGGGAGGNGGSGAPLRRDYSPPELEEHGFIVLAHLFNGGDPACRAEVFDFRQERGIGSDLMVGTTELRDWVELKAFAGPMPPNVGLTRNEFDRAREQGGRFYLAIVAGLAEGEETVVRLYRNPLATLPWSPAGAVVFSGLNQARCLECRLTHHTTATAQGGTRSTGQPASPPRP